MNNSLREGTQFEYIKRAKKEGFAVLVLNTNQNEYLEDGKKLRIPNSETPQNHARNVWSNIISKVNNSKRRDLPLLSSYEYLFFTKISGPCQTYCHRSS